MNSRTSSNWRNLREARDNNAMHAKPDLRVVLEWTIAGSGSVIADVIPPKSIMAKNITTYLLKEQDADVTFADFEECPATSFLKQSAHLWNSMQYCKTHFPKNTDANYRTDGVEPNRLCNPCVNHGPLRNIPTNFVFRTFRIVS